MTTRGRGRGRGRSRPPPQGRRAPQPTAAATARLRLPLLLLLPLLAASRARAQGALEQQGGAGLDCFQQLQGLALCAADAAAPEAQAACCELAGALDAVSRPLRPLLLRPRVRVPPAAAEDGRRRGRRPVADPLRRRRPRPRPPRAQARCFCVAGGSAEGMALASATARACRFEPALPGSAECAAAADAGAGSGTGSAAAGPAAAFPGAGAAPQARWAFDEPAGAAAVRDAGAAGLHGAPKPAGQGPRGVALAAPGPRDGDAAAEFDGVISYVSVPYNPVLNPASFTLRVEAEGQRPEVDAQSVLAPAQALTPQGLVTSFDATSTGGYALERQWVAPAPGQAPDRQPRWVLVLGTPAGPVEVASESFAEDGAWAEVVATYDSATRTAALYVDGELEALEEIPQRMLGNPDGDLWIGGGGRRTAAGGFTRPFSGRISDVALFNRALGPEQVRDIYEVARDPSASKSNVQDLQEEEETRGGIPSWAIIVVAGGAFVLCVLLATVLLVMIRRSVPKTPRWTPRSKLRQNSHAAAQVHPMAGGDEPSAPPSPQGDVENPPDAGEAAGVQTFAPSLSKMSSVYYGSVNSKDDLDL